MSDTFRKAMLNRLPPVAPTRAPWAAGNAEGMDEDQEELEEGDSMAELGQSLPSSSRSRSNDQDLSPISAAAYFGQALEVQPTSRPGIAFRAYYTPPALAAASSATASGSSAPAAKPKGSVLLCHHGAGSSGLSFAVLAKEVKERDAELGVLAFDARGHGKTKTQPVEAEHDLSLITLTADLMALIQHMFPDPAEAPALLLMGHSMGAAPILEASPALQKLGYNVPGVVVLDVVEGTAVESLPLMKGILSHRPRTFKSVIDGIHWHITSNAIRNPTSARISVPSYLTPSPSSGTDTDVGERQTWRADLMPTEPFWQEWWSGLSQKFLQAKCARLLVLAGQERLDKDLMVGQMQGKFQLDVMQDVGHYLHEDDPAHLASTVIAFWRRNTRVLVLPPKVGQAVSGGKALEVKRVGEV
ncbi:putative structural constituent of ribosome [Dioszegia hungarica]|uniref:Protein phosphatase methylesterase 1 n=1 Tax=Dioszegia hungarica TaxID=4972 RepID=A0AA38LU84_9TREE|nr:putative structural constituent of ribosome [Dioszegia hungarica]KAI9635323.1 putative structural constituent of ribosome [Dioszegia hungarica]